MLAKSEDLVTFGVVARLRSFAATAKELYITPAAVSQRISRLERSLGTRLLERTTTRVELTATGRMLLSWVEDTNHTWKLLLRAIESVDGPDPSATCWPEEVVVGRARGTVSRVHARLREAYPGTRWHIRTTSTEQEAFDLLRAGDLHMVFWHTWPFIPTPDTAGLRTTTVLRAPIRLLVSDQHPTAIANGPVDLRLLAGEPFLSRSRPEMQEAYRQICRSMGGFEPRIQHIVDDYVEVESLIAGGHGVDFGVANCRLLRGVTRVPFVGAPSSRMVLTWDDRHTPVDLVEVVRSTMYEVQVDDARTVAPEFLAEMTGGAEVPRAPTRADHPAPAG